MELDQIRQQIDQIDDQLVALYLKRLGLVAEVARCKDEADAAIDNPVREKAIIYRLTKDIADDNRKLYVKDLYGCIFTASKSYQSALLHRTSPTAERSA